MRCKLRLICGQLGGLCHQGALNARRVGNGCTRHQALCIKRSEELSAHTDKCVNLHAEQYILNEEIPRISFRVLHHKRAKSLALLRFGKSNLPVHRLRHHIHGTRHTIIFQEIVAVHSVFGARIFIQQRLQAPRLRGRQVQHLLVHASAFGGIHIVKIRISRDSQQVVGLAENEAQHEVVAFKIEDAVVVHPVRTLLQVHHAQCRMSVKFIRQVARITGN